MKAKFTPESEEFTRFSAKVSYALKRGYGTTSSFAKTHTCDTQTAIIETMKELAWIAYLGGFGGLAVSEAQSVVTRALAQAEATGGPA